MIEIILSLINSQLFYINSRLYFNETMKLDKVQWLPSIYVWVKKFVLCAIMYAVDDYLSPIIPKIN